MTLNNGMLPEAVLPSYFMTDVYLFCGTKEFMQLPSMKQKKIESAVKNFGDSLFEHTFSEYPVTSCQNGMTKLMNLGQC
jgi:hypothetical protein